MIYKGKELVVLDIEADNLYYDVTKLYCCCWAKVSEPDKIYKLTTYEEIKEFFLNENYYRIAHNGILYDIITVEKILDIKVPNDIIDTLFLSWTLTPLRKTHNLEDYGTEYGIQKPEIKDWKNLTIEEYVHRCSEDVKINMKLWQNQYEHLLEIYEDVDAAFKYIKYLTFKGVCIQHQMKEGIRVDMELCKSTLFTLETEQQSKLQELQKILPPIPIKSIKTVPKIMYKKDGTISAVGQKWLDFLKEQNLPESHNEPIEYITGYEPANASSISQVKNFLFDLGWVPDHIQFKRDKKTGKVSEIPQIKHPTNSGEVSDSVKALFDKEPKLELLENLGIINHRVGFFKSILELARNERVYAEIIGLTNTLRFQHKKPCVNLVGVLKPYGEQIRNTFIADEGHILIGTDLSGAEDCTKRHFIYPLDPEYVKEQMTEGFDPHLKIAVFAGFITEEESDEYKILEKIEDKTPEQKEKFKYLKNIRFVSKILNFSSVYNIGPPALSRQTKKTLEEAKNLLNQYWKLNWSVKEFASRLKTKTVRGQLWLQSPLNGFWLTCRKESDKFSTCNQNAGVWLLDIYISNMMKYNLKPILQMHDEALLQVKENDVEQSVENLKSSMKKLNEMLKLNVEVKCSIETGIAYGSVH